MVRIRKRGRTYHADFFLNDGRVRGSLATRDRTTAHRVAHKIEAAIYEGPGSPLWAELRVSLPRPTFERLGELVGVKKNATPTWSDLKDAFTTSNATRIRVGKLQVSTQRRYQSTIAEFDLFLAGEGIRFVQSVTRANIERFKAWRLERINKKRNARGGGGLALDVAILHRLFAFGVEEGIVSRNPVRPEGKPGGNPNRGAEPFSAAELGRLRGHAGDDLLTFLLLRWTGLRGSDAVSLTWDEVNLTTNEIEKLTQKRRKKVILPIQSELSFALEAEQLRRSPKSSECVLLNPTTGHPLTRPRLYHRMLALGKRAGVNNAHPHRFRDTLAVDMLLRGANPYDVAKMLGDTIDTVEKHYMPFVRELRDRVRSILESDAGLEHLVTTASQSSQRLQ